MKQQSLMQKIRTCSYFKYIKIDSDHFINIKMIYDNFGIEIFDVVTELHAITGCDTGHTDLMLKRITFSKKIFNTPPVSL